MSYADSLRQQAKWIDEAVDLGALNGGFDLGDVDTDELRDAAAEIERLQTELSHAGQWREAYTKEIEQLRAAQDEADALIMELIGLPFPVAYPTGSTKATAMLSWGARCTERGNQQSTTTEKSNG